MSTATAFIETPEESRHARLMIKSTTTLLIAAGAAIAGFMLGGAVRVDGPFGQAPAAWAQAFLTALAVYLAAWLQDRAVRRREEAERSAWLDTIAFTARRALFRYDAMLKEFGQKPTSAEFKGMYNPERMESILRPIQTLKSDEFEDEVLLELFSRLEDKFQDVKRHLDEYDALGKISSSSLTYANVNPAHAARTEIFNAAAGVDRHVAALNGRVSGFDTGKLQ